VGYEREKRDGCGFEKRACRGLKENGRKEEVEAERREGGHGLGLQAFLSLLSFSGSDSGILLLWIPLLSSYTFRSSDERIISGRTVQGERRGEEEKNAT